MYITTMGLVLRNTDYKETSRILTVLTAPYGRMTVTAKAARRKNSATAAGTQFLTCSEFTMSNNHGRWILTEARCIEEFLGLRDDVALLALGSYFAELLETLAVTEESAPEMLSLCLNALYALSEHLYEPELVKAAFELRLLALCGYAPAVQCCAECGNEEPVDPVLSLGGAVYCASCRPFGAAVPMSAGSLSAMRYVLSAPSKKLFSFNIGAESLKEFSEAAEKYTIAQLDRGFRSLDFYKNVKQGSAPDV